MRLPRRRRRPYPLRGSPRLNGESLDMGLLPTRFWSNVDFDSPDKCWYWKGNVYASPRGWGYGRWHYDNMRITAHIYSYTFFNGPICEDDIVRHKCDNPPCVNPYHLEIGTPADNANDMVKRGRSRRGVNHPSSKLSLDQVNEARSLKGVETALSIARRFGVARSTILGIWCGQNYANEPIKRPYKGWEYARRFRSRKNTQPRGA